MAKRIGGSGKEAEEERGREVALVGLVLHGDVLPPKKRSLSLSSRSSSRAISTDVQVKAAGPGIHKIAGVTGLTLKVSESKDASRDDADGGSFVMRYRLAGRRREIGLGSRKDVRLAEAIKRARRQRGLIDDDKDPIDERRRVRERDRRQRACRQSGDVRNDDRAAR